MGEFILQCEGCKATLFQRHFHKDDIFIPDAYFDRQFASHGHTIEGNVQVLCCGECCQSIAPPPKGGK